VIFRLSFPNLQRFFFTFPIFGPNDLGGLCIFARTSDELKQAVLTGFLTEKIRVHAAAPPLNFAQVG
jgi:hypothetical protein